MKKTEDPKPQQYGLYFLREFLSSSMAGTLIAYTTFPFEGYKKYLQRGAELVKEGKLPEKFIPYRGSAVFAANIVPTTMLQFLSDATLKKIMPEDSSVPSKITASAFSGVVGAVTATFVENTIVVQQENKIGPIAAIRDMVSQGYGRPWRSYPLIATRDGIFTFCMLWAAGRAAEIAEEKYGKKHIGGFELAGYGMAPAHLAKLGVGVVGAASSHPFDMVATQMQKSPKKITIKAAAQEVYQQYGAPGYFRGFPWRLALFILFTNVIPKAKQASEDQILDRVSFLRYNDKQSKAPAKIDDSNKTPRIGK